MSLLNELKNKNILIISPDYWGDNFVSKHHYALELTKRGNKVFFLNPPLINWSFNIQSTLISQNLYIIDYGMFLKGLNRLPFSMRSKVQVVLARWIQDYLKIEFDVVWNFDPYRFQYMKCFGADLNIYHSVDFYKTRLEREAAKFANIVLVTSDKILENLQNVRTPKFKINHGVAKKFFKESTNLSNQKVSSKIIEVGYVGNLLYKYLDTSTLKILIEENKDVQFSFVGPYEKSNLHGGDHNINFIEFLKETENVILLGQKASDEIPEYLNRFDLFLMCYTGDKNVSELANPHKLLEYLSTGKTVICHYIDEYKNKIDLLEMVENNKLFPDRFNKIVNSLDFYNSEEKRESRIKYALDNTYGKQIKRIERLISKHVLVD